MGTVVARQLCWVILGLLFLQGAFSGLSLTTEPTSPNTGEKSSSESELLTSTSTTAAPQKTSQSPPGSSNPVMLRSSITDGHSLIFMGQTQSQVQKHTADLGTGTKAPHSSSRSGGGSSTRGETSQNATSNSVTINPRTMEDLSILPSPTSETVLTVAAFGVISFIVILVVVVIILVGVVSLRFKCRKNKESEDPQKPGSSGLSESCSTANGEKDSITLISMKNINMNNSKSCPSAEKVL